MTKEKVTVSKLDISELLEDDEDIAGFLNEVLKDDDPELFYAALGHIAKAKGMSAIAEKSGLNRENLYKAFSGSKDPQFSTVNKLVHALGFEIDFKIAG